jgi:type IV secretory pathway TraG/TraD family ATPase VirD4
MSSETRARPAWELADLALAAMAAALGAGVLLWVGAWAATTVRSLPAPAFDPTRATHLLTHPADPTAAWGTPMPGPVVYWTTTGLLLLIAGAGMASLWWGWQHLHADADRDPRDLPGLATRADVRAAAGSRAVTRRARQARLSLTRPAAPDVAYRLGRARGVPAWASVEDSMLLLGPPRSGKGLHVVIPTILDAPGAVVTTSTRPDNLAVTMRAREHLGPVAVFDPQHLAAGLPGGLRWSPVRGCELPQTAMIRARGLAAGVGMTRGVEGGDFWTGQTESVLRGLLHAAAIDGRGAVDLYRWSLDPVSCSDAVTILDRSGVAPGWDEALDQAIHADPRTRDSIWLGVRQALSSLADPRVLDAVTPRPGEAFDPASFLNERGTLYLLGTSSGAGAAAALVAALVEDMVETARRIAARSAGARLDPPLLLALDEIGNLAPLPSLSALMSEGGGSGITTLTVLQSLSQARDRWGEQAANTIWDAAIVKIILGGGSNARDLADLSALIGERDEDVHSTSRDSRGGRTTSWNTRRIPVMASSRLRTLPFGTGVLLLRSARPIVLDLQPWTARRDAAALAAGRAQVEADLRRAASTP